MNTQTREAIAALENCAEILPYAITDDETKWNGEVRTTINKVHSALAALRAIDEAEATPPTDELVAAGDAMREAIADHMETHVDDDRIPYGTELGMRKAANTWDAAKARMSHNPANNPTTA